MIRTAAVYAFAALVSAHLSGCTGSKASELKSSASGPTRLGLNDVAILMPYDTHPELLEAAPGPKDFIPAFAFVAIKDILLDDEAIHEKENFAFGVTGDLAFERNILSLGDQDGPTPFKFISMRIDPCGNSIGRLVTGADCDREVRIVWQPLALVDGIPTTKDVNLHSIYHLDAESFARFIQGVRKLRAASGPFADDEALQTHPVIAKEGLGGAYLTGLMKLMAAEIKPSHLHRIAFFADTHPDFLGHWPFLAFNVSEGKVLRDPSPALGRQDGEIQKLVQRIEGAPRRLGEPLPTGDFEHNLFPAFPEPTSNDEAFLEAAYDSFLIKKYTSAIALENPSVHEPGNADCASCHMAVLTKFNIKNEMEARKLPLPLNEFSSDHWNLTSEVTQAFSQTSLQIFSYFQSRSKIAPRAVHDAALSADRINQMP